MDHSDPGITAGTPPIRQPAHLRIRISEADIVIYLFN